MGSISGTVTDQTGAVIPDTTVTALNLDTTVQQTTKTNANGYYNFTALPVGRYQIEVIREGFQPYKRTGLAIDVNSQLRADVGLTMGQQSEEVVVSDSAVQVETQSTQMGDVETGQVITAVALNGRSFTDLLSLQPSIVPMSTQTNDSVVMAGVTVAIVPSGALNAGNQSINGQREDANGFLVNGSDVKELMNGGTAIIPNLDSIAEFRVLTNNFDAEYGNYAGGIVNVVTQGGADQIHGDVFEFLRNTDLDAKDYFATHRDTYQQNQFGGTIGGPIKKERVFYFGDYQGTRTVQGLETGLINVPSAAELQGNFADLDIPATKACPEIPPFNTASISPSGKCLAVPSTVQGTALAAQLQKVLGYAVSSKEDYYTPGCASSPAPGVTQCVFPNAIIPKSAWTAPAQYLLQYIPQPNDGPNTFSGSDDERLRDDKGSFRVDANSARWGNFSAYYFFDDYHVKNPYPSGQGGATIPGFSAINLGRSQLISLSNTKTFGTSWVNEAHFSFMRSHNIVGQPSGGLGVSLASQGFSIDPKQGGIDPLAPQFEGVENTVFQGDFVMGVPITNVNQANNTFSVNQSLSKVLGSHTIKGGVEVGFEQVNVNPDAIFDGTFIFDGYQTTNDFADFLIGTPNQFNQQDSASYYPRHKYVGWYGQDSWRVKSNLTFNYGLRVDLMQYWSEKYDQVPTFNPGEQSKVYPNAFPGLVYPTDPGIPNTLVPEKFRWAPRFGLAYSPNKRGGLLGKILGASSSIRAGYGMMNSVIEGNTIGIDEPQPPYGLSGTVFNGLYAQPYHLADGTNNASPYPLTFPPLNATAGHPNPILFNNVYNPQSGMTAPPPWNTYPYTEDYFLSFERQLPWQTVLSISYVGSEGHHLLLVYSANPGNPALCLALNQPGILAGGASCGPGGENTNYTLAQQFTFGGVTYPDTCTPLPNTCTVLQGTRLGLNTGLVNHNVGNGNYYGNDDYDASIGNSNYNALQVSVRSSVKGLSYSIAYTYSKSIDQASSISDAVDPYNFNLTRALSAWNLKHNFVASYDYQLPLQRLSNRFRRVLEGWEISGVTRVASGFPVTLSTNGDQSLQGSSPNGVNNRYLDLPDFTGQALSISSNPRANGLRYFNPGAFTDNALGTSGDAARRFFSGPGMFNTDAVLHRNFQIRESGVLQLRLEVFNLFNHVQFFGPAAVNGDVDNTQLFGKVQNSAPPRLMQLAAKFTF